MQVLHLDSGKEMRGGQWQVLSLLKGLGAGNLLLTPADGPLMAAAKACGIAVEPAHDAIARGNGSSGGLGTSPYESSAK